MDEKAGAEGSLEREEACTANGLPQILPKLLLLIHSASTLCWHGPFLGSFKENTGNSILCEI